MLEEYHAATNPIVKKRLEPFILGTGSPSIWSSEPCNLEKEEALD